ncbi:MAG TPA: dTDP-4-dehydrorhamnose reductase [Spirochaetota bacterium]|nr:dTDP-4-dehydrorhamnose reductase [Spirochaetota bacterium]
MVWIPGGSGMLGRHIAEKCTAAGIGYISTDIDLDITESGAVSEFVRKNRFSWIVNCSAYTAVDLAEDEKDKAFAVNAEGIRNIAEACKGSGTKIIHFSTDYIFPGNKPGGFTENDATGPEGVYGASKLEGERFLSSIYNNFFIFRISWLYGPYGKNFVHTMLSLFGQRDELNVVDYQSGSPTYTGELADFIVRLIQSDSEQYGIYHFSGEGMTNWHEFASEIYRLAVKYGLTQRAVKINPVDSSKYPQKAKRPAYSYMIKDKLDKVFGYRPRNWKETLEGYIKLISK